MTAPFLIFKSPKSVGIAILLTFLFGPIGLFYASITGGLVMTFTPVFLSVLLFVGILQENSVLMGVSLGLLLIFVLLYWVLCIIWAVVSVNRYNEEIEYEASRQYDLYNRLKELDENQIAIKINQESGKMNSSAQGSTGSNKPSLKEWAKNNPGRSINDYFSKFGR